MSDNWTPLDDKLLATGEPVSSAFGTGLARNARAVANEWPRQHSFAWFRAYNSDAGEVDGLQIHTPPYFWKAIPLPISSFGPGPGGPASRLFRVHVYFKTIPGFYAQSSDFGGEVEIALGTNQTGPPADRPIISDTGIENPSGALVIESDTNEFSVITLDVAYQAPSPGFEDAWPGPYPILYFRSRVGKALDLPPEVMSGVKLGSSPLFNLTPRTAMELPVTFLWLGPGSEDKPALTGRLLRKRTRAQGAELSPFELPMLPWPEYYLVEHENLTVEQGSDLYRMFVMPPFPPAVYATDTTRNQSLFVGGETNQDAYYGFDSIHECTGVLVRSVLVEEITE